MNKEIANLFWHGELTNLEKTCIQSFVKHGFHTKIWSYTNIQVDGAESCDARLVLPEEHLIKYKQQFGTDDGFIKSHSSLAAFSDAFRWNLINKFGGWWFDTDCYCLKSSEEFKQLRENKPFISGLQESGSPTVACGAFYANQHISTKLVDRLNLLCDRYDCQFPKWGIIGPHLISDVVQDEELTTYILPPEKFYSIESGQTNYYVDPLLKNDAKSLITNSYVTHIWHSMLLVNNVDKNNPPENSLLKEFYDGSYTNDSLPDVEAIYKREISLERYIEISKLYKKVLNRSGDIDGLMHYCGSQVSYSQIENIFKTSEEYYRSKKKIIHTVYKPEENIDYLKDWLTHHTSIGITHFYLYDNGGANGYLDHGYNIPDGENKHGTPIKYTAEQARELEKDIIKDFPVTKVMWQHRDSAGKLLYNQAESVVHFRDIVKDGLCAFIDMDEFIIPQEEFRPCRMLQRKFKSRIYYESVYDCLEVWPVDTSDWGPKVILDMANFPEFNALIHDIHCRHVNLPVSMTWFNHYNYTPTSHRYLLTAQTVDPCIGHIAQEILRTQDLSDFEKHFNSLFIKIESSGLMGKLNDCGNHITSPTNEEIV